MFRQVSAKLCLPAKVTKLSILSFPIALLILRAYDIFFLGLCFCRIFYLPSDDVRLQGSCVPRLVGRALDRLILRITGATEVTVSNFAAVSTSEYVQLVVGFFSCGCRVLSNEPICPIRFEQAGCPSSESLHTVNHFIIRTHSVRVSAIGVV